MAPSTDAGNMLIFGLGFSGLATARLALGAGWRVTGTVRSQDKANKLGAELPGLDVIAMENIEASTRLIQAARDASHILMCAPTVECCEAGEHHDPFLALLPPSSFAGKTWVGYMSTTVAYGDWQGEWVDESSETRSTSVRGKRRLMAERQWAALASPVHIFRLAGIYGPGRNALETVRKGRARIIDKPGQVFSRIHVQDIANVVWASALAPAAHRGQAEIYNVCDDYPCEPGEVIRHACAMLDVPAPQPIAFADANLSPMGKSFYQDNKRVSNAKAKRLLGRELDFPTYRKGLAEAFKAF